MRKTTRSAFIRDAIEAEIRRDRIHKLEAQHAKGYSGHPAATGEFDVWADLSAHKMKAAVEAVSFAVGFDR